MSLIKTKVFPGSSESAVVPVDADTYEIYVRSAAQNGQANKEAIYLLSKYLSCGVKLISGGTRQNKIFEAMK
jgi:uncharacterized protein YggU (UPF0235/DUF167 family)